MTTSAEQWPVRPGPVLVTGANSGIGLAAALRFADRGWETWGTVRTPAKARDLRRAAKQAGVTDRLHALVLDVSDHDALVARWPRLPDFWAVVNNAGGSLSGAVEDVTAAQAKALLDINLVTPAIVSACALPGMRALGGGRIVMVSSVAGRAAVLPLHAWYHASKFGLEALSDILRVEVAPFGVKVAVVEPGFVRTAIGGKAEAQLGRRVDDDSPYAAAYGRTRQLTALVERVAPTPEVVARVIVSAVESKRPRARYPIGLEVGLIPAVRLAPTGVLDRIMHLAADLGGTVPSAKGRT